MEGVAIAIGDQWVALVLSVTVGWIKPAQKIPGERRQSTRLGMVRGQSNQAVDGEIAEAAQYRWYYDMAHHVVLPMATPPFPTRRCLLFLHCAPLQGSAQAFIPASCGFEGTKKSL